MDVALHHAPPGSKNSAQFLKETIQEVLQNLQNDTELFETFLRSMPSRFAAVRAANDGHSDY